MNLSNKKRLCISVVSAILALIAAKALGFLGFALAGAGHGSGVLGFPFLSPIIHFDKYPYVPLGPYIWATVGAVLPWVSNRLVKWGTIILVITNYLSAVKDIVANINETGTLYYVYQLFIMIPEVAVPLVLVYVVAQVFVFWRIVAADNTKRNASNTLINKAA